MKEIEIFEPWLFIFFGVFHLHRIWALIDRASYAEFWLGVMEEKHAFYYVLMGILTLLCLLGIFIFWRNRRNNFWWRWIYFLCGGYLLFDLFAIAVGLDFWQKLIYKMFDTSASYWNLLWVGFILLGGASLLLGIALLKKQNQMKAAGQ